MSELKSTRGDISAIFPDFNASPYGLYEVGQEHHAELVKVTDNTVFNMKKHSILMLFER